MRPSFFRKITPRVILGGIVAASVWLFYDLTRVELPHEGEPPRIYANQCRDDLRQCFVKAIDEANSSVYLSIYTLTEPKVLGALNKAAERGKEIVVVSHGKKRPKLNDKIELIPRTRSALMHQKVMVVDGKQVWIGSANMTRQSLRTDGNAVVAFEHPELAKALQENMLEKRAQGPPHSLGDHAYTVGEQSIEVWQGPSKEGLERVKGLIREAQERVEVAMFTWTHPELTEEVIQAHGRGLRVAAVIDHNSGVGVSKNSVEALTAGGVPTALNNGPEHLHHKLALIDNTVVCGSTNWSRSGFERNEECFVILHEMTPEQKAKTDKLWKIIWLESKDAV